MTEPIQNAEIVVYNYRCLECGDIFDFLCANEVDEHPCTECGGAIVLIDGGDERG